MSLLSLLNRTLIAKRQTDVLLDTTAIVAQMALTQSAGQTCPMLVTVSGSDPVGSVKLVGNVAGVSTSETLTFTGVGAVQSQNQWDTGILTSIQPTGLTGSLNVKARTPAGQPVLVLATRIASFLGRIEPDRPKFDIDISGGQSVERWRLFMLVNTTTLQANDQIVDGSVTYQVLAPEVYDGARGAHHWEFEMNRLAQ